MSPRAAIASSFLAPVGKRLSPTLLYAYLIDWKMPAILDIAKLPDLLPSICINPQQASSLARSFIACLQLPGCAPSDALFRESRCLKFSIPNEPGPGGIPSLDIRGGCVQSPHFRCLTFMHVCRHPEGKGTSWRPPLGQLQAPGNPILAVTVLNSTSVCNAKFCDAAKTLLFRPKPHAPRFETRRPS